MTARTTTEWSDLRALIARHKVSRDALAKELGVRPPALSQFLNDDEWTTPRPEKAEEIAAAVERLTAEGAA